MMRVSSTATRSSNSSSSPSSTLSESSNSPIFIYIRKPRTRRKRPNQKYNEAAALLSTACPNIFPSKSPPKFSSTHESDFFDEPSELLLPFRDIDKSEFLLQNEPVQENGRQSFKQEPKWSPLGENPCQSPGEIEIQSNPAEFFNGYLEDFDADSILDEEIEEGIIDTIMGNVNATDAPNDYNISEPSSTGFRSRFGGKFDFGFGKFAVVNALRNVNGVNNWWDFHLPTVDVFDISPKFSKSLLPKSAEKKKRDVQEPVKPEEEPKNCSESLEASPSTTESNPKPKLELLLKLDYDSIATAWSGRGSPYSYESIGSDSQGNDISTRLAQIDLFSEAGGGVREARVQRYKEKRRTRLFSKKIRYQVRKVSADQRPRMKGRFVRQSNSGSNRKR